MSSLQSLLSEFLNMINLAQIRNSRIEMQVLMDYYDEDINILTGIVANLSKVNRNYSIISS